MKNWTARVEWNTPDDYDSAALDLVMEHLAGHSPAIGREAGDTMPGVGTWSATVTVQANTLRQATAAVLELVEGSTGERATGVEVLAEEVFDARTAEPRIPDLVGYAEIAEMLGVSKQRARQLADNPGFPHAAVNTKAGPLRVRSRVEAWAAHRNRSPGRPAKTPAGTPAG